MIFKAYRPRMHIQELESVPTLEVLLSDWLPRSLWVAVQFLAFCTSRLSSVSTQLAL